jgi:metal-dependent amidase/aminoacylase/carboxypeptidase family protein
MKFFVIFAIGLFIVVVKAMDKNEAKEMFRNMSQDCKEQEKASDADVETMVNENYPETTPGKCLVACMQETFGIVCHVISDVLTNKVIKIPFSIGSRGKI